MKLNRTREEWASLSGFSHLEPDSAALEDLATLFAEVDRLTAQLAERDARINELEHYITDEDYKEQDEIKDLRVQLAEREGRIRELEAAVIEMARNDPHGWLAYCAERDRFRAAAPKKEDRPAVPLAGTHGYDHPPVQDGGGSSTDFHAAEGEG